MNSERYPFKRCFVVEDFIVHGVEECRKPKSAGGSYGLQILPLPCSVKAAATSATDRVRVIDTDIHAHYGTRQVTHSTQPAALYEDPATRLRTEQNIRYAQ